MAEAEAPDSDVDAKEEEVQKAEDEGVEEEENDSAKRSHADGPSDEPDSKKARVEAGDQEAMETEEAGEKDGLETEAMEQSEGAGEKEGEEQTEGAEAGEKEEAAEEEEVPKQPSADEVWLEALKEEGDDAWADMCTRAMTAFQEGANMDVYSMPETTSKPPLMVIKVPDDYPAGYIRGKENARVLEWYKDYGTVVVFAQLGEPPKPAAKPEVGAVVQGKFGNSWFDATVLEAIGDNKYKVKWKFDDSEVELSADEICVKDGDTEAAESKELPPVEEGTEVEGKHGDTWSAATVVADGKATVAIKWKHDDSIAALPRNEVRLKSTEESKPEEPEKAEDVGPVDEGTVVEGKFGNSWFEATVVTDGKSTIVIKWKHDDSVGALPRNEVRLKGEEGASAEPADSKTVVLIFGGKDHEARLKVELKVLHAVEKKAPGHISAKPRESDEGDGFGYTVIPLLNDGEYMGRLIGKGGSKLKTIMKVCESTLEFIGKHAYILGTGPQRARTAIVVGLLQTKGDPLLPSIPDGLEALCRSVKVPKGADATLCGDKRAALNQIEGDTSTLVFFTAPPSVSASAKPGKATLAVGAAVEVQRRGAEEKHIKGAEADSSWVEAEILKIFRDDSDDEDEGDTMIKVKFASDSSEGLIPFLRVRAKLEGDAGEEQRKADRARQTDAVMMTLFVVGQEPDRVMAESRLMVAIEAATPGSYSGEGEMVVKKMDVTADEAWYCQAASGRRKSAARAAGCGVIEVVAQAVYVAGPSSACDLALVFAKALLVETPDSSVTDKIDDSQNKKTLVSKDKRANLTEEVIAQIEADTQTFIYFDNGAVAAGLEDELRAVACGQSETAIQSAIDKLAAAQEVAPESSWGAEKWDDKDKWEAKEWEDKSQEKSTDKKWEEEKSTDKKWQGKSEPQDSGGDKRVHPSDKTNTAYTKAEFLAFSDGDQKKADRMWDESKPAKDAGGSGKADWKSEPSWDAKKDAGGSGKADWKSEPSWDAKKESGGDKRVHPSDKTNTAYTKEEFVAFSNGDQKKGLRMWDEAKPAKDAGGGGKADWKAESSWDAQKDAGGGGKAAGGKGAVRPGDWTCPGCGANVFASKAACFKCGATKDSGGGGGGRQDDSKSAWAAKEDKWWEKKEPEAKANDWGKQQNEAKSWGSQKDSGGEKRVHPSDKTNTPYSYEEFLGFDQKKGERMWNESKPAQSKAEGKPWAAGGGGGGGGGGRDQRQQWDKAGSSAWGEPAAARGQKRPWEPEERATSSRPSNRANGPVVPSQPPQQGRGPPVRQPPTAPARDRVPARNPPVAPRPARRLVEEEDDDEMPASGSYAQEGSMMDAGYDEAEQSIPEDILAEMAFPKSIQEWSLVQDLVFAGHAPLPEGWIRSWSRSRKCVYFVRMGDNTSVFDINKVK